MNKEVIMAKIKGGNCKTIREPDISVKERISIYDSAMKTLKSSPEKTRKYLKSTGIYTPTGRLTKTYK